MTLKKGKFLEIFLVAVILILLIIISTTYAEAASVSFSGKETYKNGDNVSVTIRYTGETYGSSKTDITFDTNYLKYDSFSGNAVVNGGSGKVIISMVSTNADNLSCTINFKAVKAGKTSVKAETVELFNQDGTQLSVPGKTISISINDPSQAASGNANLSSLKVSAGSLSPSFSPNTTSYTVNVANSVTTCTMTATKADPNATLSVSGSASLSVGKNTRSITVTAQNGTTKTYTVTIYRAAADADNDADEDEDKDKDDENERPEQLEVSVGEKEYVVVENYADIEIPQGLAVTVAKLGEYDIPALADKDLKYTLVLLYDEETGDNAWFFYDQESSEFSASVPMSTDELIDFLAAATSERAEKVEAQEGITTNTILFIALGVTGAALLAVIIALQVKIIRKGK